MACAGKEPKQDSHSLEMNDSRPQVFTGQSSEAASSTSLLWDAQEHYIQARQETIKTGKQNLSSKTTLHLLDSLSKETYILWKGKFKN